MRNTRHGKAHRLDIRYPIAMTCPDMLYYASFGDDGPNVCDNVSDSMKSGALRALLLLLAHHGRGVSAVVRSGAGAFLFQSA